MIPKVAERGRLYIVNTKILIPKFNIKQYKYLLNSNYIFFLKANSNSILCEISTKYQYNMCAQIQGC